MPENKEIEHFTINPDQARLDLGMHKGQGVYCRVHDLFDCWFSHGPAHADRRVNHNA